MISPKYILAVGLFSLSFLAFAQFEDEAASVALDNTEHQFFGNGFRPTQEDFTKGGSSMKGGFRQNNGGTAGAFLSFQDVTVTWDYKILPGTVTDFEIIGFDEFGEVVKKQLPNQPTNGWKTDQFYLPPEVNLFQWFILIENETGGVFIDNVRITRGDQTSSPSPRSREDCNADNLFFNNELSQAVDNTRFNFFTSDFDFIKVNDEEASGGDAAQSPFVPFNESAYLAAGIISGAPFTLTWNWKVSSHATNAELVFVVLDQAGNTLTNPQRISGEQDWAAGSVVVPAGNVFVVWFYFKGPPGAVAGQDRAWVDSVNIGGIIDEECPTISLTPIYDLLLE